MEETLYVLQSLSGRLVVQTATTNRQLTWERSFDYIADFYGKDDFRWIDCTDATKRNARRLGWKVVRARLTVAP